MSPRPPRAVNFPPRAFTVAEALQKGVPPKRLRAADLVAPFHGVRLRAGWDAGLPDTMVLEERCRALTRVLPPHRAGVIGHQTQLADNDTDLRHGFLVTTPERTWCDLATLLPLEYLVAVGDRLIHRSLPATTIDRLERAVDSYGAARGVRLLRDALRLLDDGSESPRESIQRLIIVLAGLPRPVTNYEVFDDEGAFVARVDLAYPDVKISMDYEGDQHRTDKRQWRRDIVRFRRLGAIGWDAKRYTADDIESPASFLAELRESIARRS